MRVQSQLIESRTGCRLLRHEFIPDEDIKDGLVVVHGFGEHGARYAQFSEYMTSRGFFICAVDLPGNGGSDGQRGDIESFDVVVTIIEEMAEYVRRKLASGNRMGLYGHSMGGLFVLAYLCRRQPFFDFAWISSPLMRPGNQLNFIMKEILKILSRFIPKMSSKKVLDTSYLSRDMDVVEGYQNDPLVHGTFSVRAGMMFINLEQAVVLHPLSGVLPILVTHGTADKISPCQFSQDYFTGIDYPAVTYRLIDGGYHELHNDICKEDLFSLFFSWFNDIV